MTRATQANSVAVNISAEDKHAAQLKRVADRYSVAITPAMQDLIEPQNPNDPIAMQFVPTIAELNEDPLDVSDPIGDTPHSPLKGIVHRYPDRLLLMPLTVCPVYCRFCFRRETVGPAESAMLNDAELEAALDYVRENQNVWEVILSGGDPLMLSPRRLQKIMAALGQIEHVKVIRIHTRVPVVDPQRINCDLLNSLKLSKAVYVVLHSNHPRELTPAAQAACAAIVDAGMPMLSQSVLLKGVNDNVDTLAELLRTLVENRIKPYYLHHADRAPGTAHFRTSIAAGQALLSQLRGLLSGLCQPEYILDIPGGHGKVPIGPVWHEAPQDTASANTNYLISDPDGQKHQYVDQSSD